MATRIERTLKRISQECELRATGVFVPDVAAMPAKVLENTSSLTAEVEDLAKDLITSIHSAYLKLCPALHS